MHKRGGSARGLVVLVLVAGFAFPGSAGGVAAVTSQGVTARGSSEHLDGIPGVARTLKHSRVPGMQPGHSRAHALPAMLASASDGLGQALQSRRVNEATYAYQRALSVFRPSRASHAFGPLANPDALEGTLVLRDLRLRLGDLSKSDRAAALTLFGRPDDGSPPVDPQDPKYTVPSQVQCFTHVCVHYVTTTKDAVRTTDANADGTPDWVATVGATLEQVWSVTVTTNGFRAPKSDLTSPQHGPNGLLDIYLADIPMYGFVTTDDPHSLPGSTYPNWDMSAYMVLDNDFSPGQFDVPNLSGELGLRLATSHEFMHTVQYAYDFGEDPYFMEGTAAWNEDIVFDSLNTRYPWLRYTALAHPEWSLDWNHYNETYGSLLFWRFWSEYYSTRFDAAGQAQPDPGVLKSLFALTDGAPGGPDYAAMQAIYVYANQQGAASGVRFRDIMAFFGIWNAIPATPPVGTTNSLYEEGAFYPPALMTQAFNMTPSAPSTGAITQPINHLSRAYFDYTVGAAVPSTATLNLTLNLPPLTNDISVSHDPQAHLITVPVTGAPSVSTIALNAAGDASVNVGFNGSTIKRVILVLTNASERYDCSVPQTTYWCQPMDDNDPFVATAVLRPTGAAAGTAASTTVGGGR